MQKIGDGYFFLFLKPLKLSFWSSGYLTVVGWLVDNPHGAPTGTTWLCSYQHIAVFILQALFVAVKCFLFQICFI